MDNKRSRKPDVVRIQKLYGFYLPPTDALLPPRALSSTRRFPLANSRNSAGPRGQHTHRYVCASSCLVSVPEGTKGVRRRAPRLC